MIRGQAGPRTLNSDDPQLGFAAYAGAVATCPRDRWKQLPDRPAHLGAIDADGDESAVAHGPGSPRWT
jgi:hypothetical protein